MVKFGIKQHKKILVVDVGRASLKIAYFLRSPSRLELLDYSLEKLNPEEDNVGQITDFIRSFLKKNSLSIDETILSISDTVSVAMKYCVLPALAKKEILPAAIWQLKDEAPFDLNLAYSDWRVVKEFTDEEGARHQGIIFVFSRKEAVEKYLSCLHQCNLYACAIVASALNYIDILKGIAEDKRFTCEMVLDLEYLDSILNLYIDKKLYFTRYLPVSVDSFTRSLIGTLFSDKGKVELTLKEAEEIRDTVGIPLDETASIRDNLQASQIISLIRPILENLVREAKQSITYFTENLKERPPQIIYLVGLGANLKNLDTYLGKELGFPVARLPFPKVLDTSRIDPARLAKDQSQIVSCVGATLSAAAGINLLSGVLKLRRFKEIWIKRLKPLALAAGGLILLLMLISVLMLPVYNYRLKKAKDYFKGKRQLLSFFEKTRAWNELLFGVSLQRVPVDAVLNFISQSVPDSIGLEELELDQYRGELTLQGEARQAQDVESFLAKLKSSGYFLSLKLCDKNAANQNFKIKCKLKY